MSNIRDEAGRIPRVWPRRCTCDGCGQEILDCTQAMLVYGAGLCRPWPRREPDPEADCGVYHAHRSRECLPQVAALAGHTEELGLCAPFDAPLDWHPVRVWLR